MHTLAVDIGGTKFSLAVFKDNQMLQRMSRATDREGSRDWMMDQIVRQAQQWQAELGLNRGGIGFGGPVDWNTQRVILSTHVPGWADTPLPQLLEQELGLPMIMDNDANVGALGEAIFGAGQTYDPLFYLTLSTGIGGGIVINNTIMRGADSYGGEIGHINLRPDGPECLCGDRGCFERLCCGLWLERDYGRPAHELLREPAFVERYVVNLAAGLKPAIMLLNPARIVIGGGISKAGPALFEPLRAELRRQIPGWSRARLDVVPAALGDDSVLYGALALARQAGA
jgi:glucokinase